MSHWTKLRATALAGALAVSLGGAFGGPAAAEDITISMAVPDWPPTHIMQDLFNKEYKAKSGNNVKLVLDFIPWPDYYTRLAASLTSGEKKYNMAVSDSQWLGAFIEGGYFRKINDILDKDPELQAIFKDLHPNLVASYSTYPYKSANFYGFPQMPDLLITYYRKDVFCNEEEQKAFQEKMGYKLPCTPEEMNEVDWKMWEDFGKFFRRAKGDKLAGQTLDDDFYGIAYQAGKGYDFSTTSVNNFIWQYGGSMWDETQIPKGQALGVVNSDIAVKAMEHFLSLLQYAPPVAKSGTMDIFKTDELFREGKLGAHVEWIGFAETTINKELSKVADKAGFAMAPALKGPDGKLIRWSNIGGQPFVLTTWTEGATLNEAIEFCKWWLSKDIQNKFAAAGGQSGLKSVYSTPEYMAYRPWNHAFGPSLDWQKDYWHIPEFFELLTEQQEEFDKAITGQQSAKQALDNIAAFQDKTLRESGLIKD